VQEGESDGTFGSQFSWAWRPTTGVAPIMSGEGEEPRRPHLLAAGIVTHRRAALRGWVSHRLDRVTRTPTASVDPVPVISLVVPAPLRRYGLHIDTSQPTVSGSGSAAHSGNGAAGEGLPGVNSHVKI